MLTTTVQSILRGHLDNLDIGEVYYTYLVADKGIVFYVGQSKYPVQRLKRHLSEGKLGGLVECNLPDAYNWIVKLLPVGGEEEAAEAERTLIARYRPCLNITYNPYPRPLPECYKAGQRIITPFIYGWIMSIGIATGALLRLSVLNGLITEAQLWYFAIQVGVFAAIFYIVWILQPILNILAVKTASGELWSDIAQMVSRASKRDTNGS